MRHDVRQTTQTAILWALFLVALAIVGRFAAHWPNFTPMIAVALFAGFYFRGWLAVAAPLAALLLSDLAIGFYPPGEMAFVYAGTLLAVAVGRASLRPGLSAVSFGVSTLGGSVVFFLLSNFGVWVFGGIYPLTVEGLLACYVAGLPFFKFTVAGTAVWLAALLGLYALAARFASEARGA